MYMKRDLEKLLKKVAGLFPAVLVTGARQTGKTTLLKNLFNDAKYVTFDDPAMQSFAKEDPAGFISRYSDRQTILDEIQYVPELFSYLKMEIDSNRDLAGQRLMTGSQQFNMMKDVSDSLAGRIAIVDLFPMSYNEYNVPGETTVENILWNGTYPEVIVKPEIRDTWIPSYIRTYVERDVRDIVSVSDLSLFQTFLGLCAANHSQELNLAGISRSSGVSIPTVKRWISILESSFIIYLLRPFHTNIGKRLVKSPKMYFIDSSIPSYLTRQGNKESLFNGSMSGAFFEGFIVSETLKIIRNSGKNIDISFWRSHDGMEIDLIITSNDKYYPIEIKKTGTPTRRHAQSLEKFISLFEGKTEKAFVVCTIDKEKPLTANVSAVSWQEYLKQISEILT